MKRYLLWGVAIAAAAGCTSTTANFSPASPTGSTPPKAAASSKTAPATIQGRPGQTAHLNYGKGATADVTVESVADKATGISDIAETPQFGRYAVVDVLIQQTTGSASYNELDFKFQEPDGRSFDTFSGHGDTAGYEPALSSGTLTAGQKIRGFITFDVPAVAGGVVQVSDGFGKIIAQWTTS